MHVTQSTVPAQYGFSNDELKMPIGDAKPWPTHRKRATNTPERIREPIHISPDLSTESYFYFSVRSNHILNLRARSITYIWYGTSTAPLSPVRSDYTRNGEQRDFRRRTR